MTMTPSLRKLALTTHVTASVGWLGALAVFLAHTIASMTSQDALIVRAACMAMGLTAWFVIFPLSIAWLITGLVQALGTAWGLFRHYWVLGLLLTSLATAVLLLKLAPIGYLADAAARPGFSPADLVGLRASLYGLRRRRTTGVATVATLAIYKPAGMTPFGVRKQREHSSAGVGVGPEMAISMPRWVNVFMVVAIVFMLLIGIMMLAGEHGPGAHMSTDG